MALNTLKCNHLASLRLKGLDNDVVHMTTMCSNQLNLANLSTGCASKDGHTVMSSDDESDTDDETATRDLNSWRTAVNNATSAAQLSIYVAQLVRCVAWEKSIMKVVGLLLHFDSKNFSPVTL